MTRSFARDLGKHRIRVNTIVPGWVMTERQKTLWVSPGGARAPPRAPMPALPDRAGLSRPHGPVPRLGRFGDVHSEQLHGRGGVDIGRRGQEFDGRVAGMFVPRQATDEFSDP